MSIVAFITRDASGTNQHGTSVEGNPSSISASYAKDISLNLSPSDVESYARRGRNLVLTLTDGTEVELTGFYDEAATGDKNLFLSDNGAFTEVVLEDKADGMLFASYEPIDISGKWSAYDDMVFLDVNRIEPVVAPLAAPLLGGLGAAGAAAAGAAALLVGGDDDGDGDGDTGGGGTGGGGTGGGGTGGGDATVPTVNDAEDTYLVGEGDPDGVTISGTGEEGSNVEVMIGTTVVTTTVGEDGTWSVNVPTDDLPDDGDYETVVNVVAPDGTEYDNLDGPTISIDSEPPVVEITEGTQSVGDIVNGSEQQSGTVISGTGEPGATVTLVIGGASQTTTVADNGGWSVAFGSADISTGEYETEITITTTDPYGNSTTTTDVLEVDTLTSVSIDSGLAGGDDIVTSAEAAGGVAITGQAEAGAAISVVIQDVLRTTTADDSGVWSVTYESGTLTHSESLTEISVTATDAAGNTATDTAMIEIDMDAGYVTLSADPIKDDDIINAVERGEGVTIKGTATPGEEVTVTLGTATGTTISDVDGNWSYDFDAAEIPVGTETLAITASITDEHNNTEQASDTVVLDTEVTNYTTAENQATDGTVNRAERGNGFELTGTVEEGSTVSVKLEHWSEARVVDEVDSDGNWRIEIAADDIPAGDPDTAPNTAPYTLEGTVFAEDQAGNKEELPISLDVDTDFNTPVYKGNTVDEKDNVDGAKIENVGDTITVHSMDGAGAVDEVNIVNTDTDGGNKVYSFEAAIPDGTNLIVTGTDDAGNTSSTLVLYADNATEANIVGNAELSDFNVETLKLDYAADVELTLTEDDINALSSNGNTLTILGGADDTVNIVGGATNNGIITTTDGHQYQAFSVGDGDTTLLVDIGVDVNVVI